MNTLATAHLAFVGLVCWGLAVGSPNRFAGPPFPSGQSAPVVSQRIVFEPSEASDFRPVMIFRNPRSHKRLYYTPLSTDLYLASGQYDAIERLLGETIAEKDPRLNDIKKRRDAGITLVITNSTGQQASTTFTNYQANIFLNRLTAKIHAASQLNPVTVRSLEDVRKHAAYYINR